MDAEQEAQEFSSENLRTQEDYANYGPKLRARIAELDATIARQPHDATLYWRRGRLKMELGDWVHEDGDEDSDMRPEGHRIMDDGFADYSRALELDPDNVAYLKVHASYCHWNGHWQQAIDDYGRLIALDPTNPSYHYTRADWYSQRQQFASAIAEYTALIEMLTHRPDGWQVTWPDWLQKQGVRASGAMVDELGLNAPNSLARVYAERAMCYRGLEQYEQAIADYTTLIDRGLVKIKFGESAYVYRAQCYEELQQYDKALADYELAEQVQPAANYAAAKAKLHQEMGANKESVADFTAAIARMEGHLAAIHNPPPPPSPTPLSREQLFEQLPPQLRATAETDPQMLEQLREQFQQSATAFGRGISPLASGLQQHSLQDNLADLYRNRAAVYTKLGQPEQAAADYGRAIELAYFQTRVSDYTNRGNAYRDLKRYDEAIADYNVAVEQASDPRAAHQQRVAGYQRDQAGQFSQMLSSLQQRAANLPVVGGMVERMKETFAQLTTQTGQHLRDLDLPDNTPQLKHALFNRGVAFAMSKRYEQAIADFDAFIALDSTQAVVYNNRGNAYKGLKRYDEALADYHHALALDPDNHLAYANRAATYMNMGRLDEATADMQRALAMDPDNANKIYNYAILYAKKQQGGEALAYLQRALQLNPDLRENARDPEDFGWLVEHDPQFAAEWRRLVGESDR